MWAAKTRKIDVVPTVKFQGLDHAVDLRRDDRI
jgi:hypothetical protein